MTMSSGVTTEDRTDEKRHLPEDVPRRKEDTKEDVLYFLKGQERMNERRHLGQKHQDIRTLLQPRFIERTINNNHFNPCLSIV